MFMVSARTAKEWADWYRLGGWHGDWRWLRLGNGRLGPEWSLTLAVAIYIVGTELSKGFPAKVDSFLSRRHRGRLAVVHRGTMDNDMLTWARADASSATFGARILALPETVRTAPSRDGWSAAHRTTALVLTLMASLAAPTTAGPRPWHGPSRGQIR